MHCRVRECTVAHKGIQGADVMLVGTEKKNLTAKKNKISPNFGDNLSSDGNPAISSKLWQRRVGKLEVLLESFFFARAYVLLV